MGGIEAHAGNNVRTIVVVNIVAGIAVDGFRPEKQVIESESGHGGPRSTLPECDSQSEKYGGAGDWTQLKPVASRIPRNRLQTVLMNVCP
jgi:hypothetical protein